MKKYKASAISKTRSLVMNDAFEHGVLIQEHKTNGDIKREFVIISKDEFVSMDSGFDKDDEPRVYPEEF